MTAGFDNKPPELPSWTQLLGINLRKLRFVLLIGLLFAVLGWHGYRQFRVWQHRDLIRQAHAFLASGDFRSAGLSAQRALQLDPIDADATRILAGIAGRAGSPASVFWYGRLAELEPGNLEDALTWASTALRFGELSSADQALSTVSRRGRQTAAYHETAATLALALERYALAERHFLAAARLEPGNQSIQLNLATLRLQSTNDVVRTAALAELERLRHQAGFETLALRALAVDAERQHNTNLALAFAGELQKSPQAAFDDHLAYLDLLYRVHHPSFDSYLRELRTLCGSQPENIYTLLTWMNAHGAVDQSLAWANRLPPKLATQLPIPVALAEACMLRRDWARLHDLITDAQWGPLDCIRFAFEARMRREQNQYRQFEATWQQARNATQDNPQLLALLARVAGAWGWTAEAEAAWWTIANGDSGQAGALESLYRLYTAKKDTPNLYRVSERIYHLNPNDLAAKNNLAQLSLLLSKDVETGRVLALENFQKHPANPAFLSTYAFSLYQQGRLAEAVKLFGQIQEPLRRQSSLAAYYGVLLAANGDRQAALPYLTLADKAPQLLPEEQALVTAALTKLTTK